jgi:putative transposase
MVTWSGCSGPSRRSSTPGLCPPLLSELQAELDTYLDYYNRRRPHMALGGLAPLEFLAKMQEESVPQESQMC